MSMTLETAAEVGRQEGTTDATVVRFLRVTVVIGGALAVIGSAVLIANGHAGLWWSEALASLALFSVFFAVVVWLVISQQPRNAVVRTLAASAFFGGLWVVGHAGVAMVVDDPTQVLVGAESVVPADLPASAAWILMFTQPAFLLALFPLLTFGLLLFPDGRLPSARWRWVGVFAGVGMLLATVSWAWGFRPWNTAPTDESLLLDTGFVAIVLAVILSFVALVGRFRRSSGATRQQFKWIVWGASILVPTNVVGIMLGGGQFDDLIVALFMVGTAIFLVSYAIAITRYRLYDVDVVINKTVMVCGDRGWCGVGGGLG